MNTIVEKLKQALDEIHDGCDFTDIGNAIGIFIAENSDGKQMGYDIDDFEDGFSHGVSLIDGTHNDDQSIGPPVRIPLLSRLIPW